MKKFVRNGVKFSIFERDGETYLCTGNPTGELKFDFAGEVADYAVVVGATSVVSGETDDLDELYEKWLHQTSFHREVLGVKY
jgi:hypothetical protein